MRFPILLAAGAALSISAFGGLWGLQEPPPFSQGSQLCADCHQAENGVWQGTKHFESFRTVQKAPAAMKVLEAAGGSKNMKANETCTLCHFTMTQKDASARPAATSGTSCESCHGASSAWFPIHNDYGGKGITRDAEKKEHREERIAKARAAGMNWPSMTFDLASNCMTCHGLTHPSLSGEMIAKMVDAGHPIEPEFEVVRFSQGTVMHRFYPPTTDKNKEMTPAEKARLFVAGQAAAIVNATAALKRTDNAAYKAAQQKRIDAAKAVLDALKDFPEAAALLADPSESNGRKLADAIAGKDLTAQVGKLLPEKSTYK